MKLSKWMRLAIVFETVLPCVIIAAVVSLMMMITFVIVITHVGGLKIKCNCHR